MSHHLVNKHLIRLFLTFENVTSKLNKFFIDFFLSQMRDLSEIRETLEILLNTFSRQYPLRV